MSDPLAARDGARPPWSAFREALDAVGFRPSKTRGQNFLVDSNAARSIAADAGIVPGERVLEVGAGCGFLTLHLLERGARLVAAEIDPRLAEVARRLVGADAPVTWWVGDALEGKHALAPGLRAELPGAEPWHLVANLPYSISAPLLVVLARLPNPPRSMTVLLQEEVAARLVAAPGQPAWGALGARLALTYRALPGRPIGAQLFWPRPRVASRVVRLEQRPGPPPAEEVHAFDRLVDELFRQRRKQLAGVLAARLGDRGAVERLLAGQGIDPRARPEALEPRTLLALALALERYPAWRGRGAQEGA